MKAFRIIISVILVIVICIVGYIGLFSGNALKYLPAFQKSESSELQGQTVVFLGSSVTNGFGSYNISFVDYLTEIYKINAIKEAVNGTTLVDNGTDSYVSRLKGLDRNMKVKMVMCQFSTNDATQKLPLGTVGESFEMADFNTKTVAGAIEYIIAYSKDAWNCKVCFYTSFKYDSPEYEEMRQILLDIQKKWNISVLDLWENEELNAHGKNHMIDDIHPTLVCYKDDITPLMYNFILENIK